MKKKKAGIVIGLLLVATVLFMVSALTKNSDVISEQTSQEQDIPCIIVDSEGIQGQKSWDLFVHNSKNRQVTNMQIKYQYDKSLSEDSSNIIEQYNAYLSFDGESYCYSSDGLDEKYTYLLELTGHLNNAVCDTTFVILSNELYSFEQIAKSIYSSNSADHIPYRLLFSEISEINNDVKENTLVYSFPVNKKM